MIALGSSPYDPLSVQSGWVRAFLTLPVQRIDHQGDDDTEARPFRRRDLLETGRDGNKAPQGWQCLDGLTRFHQRSRSPPTE